MRLLLEPQNTSAFVRMQWLQYVQSCSIESGALIPLAPVTVTNAVGAYLTTLL